MKVDDTLGAGELDEDVVGRGGDGLDDDNKHGAQLIPDLPFGPGASTHQNTQGKTQGQGDSQGGKTQLEGDGGLLGHDGVDGDPLPVADGGAQIPGEKLFAEVPKLFGKGIGEAQLLKAQVDLGLGELIVIFKISLNRHEPQQGEDHRDDDGHGEEGAKDTF